ncbi:general transcription factor II-I repeat domain-containing protein 2B-like [Leptinotarsa decemlineata]|uniref:general transcription factor II-I repeat domain-containing protein 2B-like n=1 Tax=Leptinotarsa decemlineata TaxID=7539 RepID=UPI003D30C694
MDSDDDIKDPDYAESDSEFENSDDEEPGDICTGDDPTTSSALDFPPVVFPSSPPRCPTISAALRPPPQGPLPTVIWDSVEDIPTVIPFSKQREPLIQPDDSSYTIMSVKPIKRKIDSENRIYKESWESDYLIANNNGKLQCLVCMNVVSVPKEYNVRRHYTTVHENKYATYTNESRRALVADLKKKLKQQTGMFSKILHSQTHSLHASYAVSLELAKAKKPFTDGNLIKKCAVEMAKAFGDSKMAEKFESVPLSHQTIQRRIVAMGEQVEKSMLSLVKKSSYFSLCLDESTDQTDISQLLIFVRTTFDDFTSKEELFDICPLYGTTKGKDIYEAVKKTVDRIGGFDKCSAIATDGAPSMTGKKIGLVGLLRENGVTCPTIHCIIHQGALCGKSVKEDQVFQTVIKIINMIRGGNRSLLHRQLKQFLVETEAEYGDLLMYNHVRWLSAGKCMERFFAIRKEIPAFLNKYVSSDTTELEEKFKDPEFLRQLAFITDLTNHLNKLNLSLQGRNQTVSDLIGMINGFRNKLNVFKRALEKNNLTHFPSCLQIAEEFNGSSDQS